VILAPAYRARWLKQGNSDAALTAGGIRSFSAPHPAPLSPRDGKCQKNNEDHDSDKYGGEERSAHTENVRPHKEGATGPRSRPKSCPAKHGGLGDGMEWPDKKAIRYLRNGSVLLSRPPSSAQRAALSAPEASYWSGATARARCWCLINFDRSWQKSSFASSDKSLSAAMTWITQCPYQVTLSSFSISFTRRLPWECHRQ